MDNFRHPQHQHNSSFTVIVQKCVIYSFIFGIASACEYIKHTNIHSYGILYDILMHYAPICHMQQNRPHTSMLMHAPSNPKNHD